MILWPKPTLGATTQEEYIFFGGQRVGRRDTTSTGTTIAVHYYFSDHLGSHGVVTNATGSVIEQDIDYYPYGGQEYDYSTAQVAQHYKFTGKERDAESGLDNLGARYDNSALGRFMTPDWAAKPVTVPYAKFGDPQSLNLYSYTENGPLNRIDPDGHMPAAWVIDRNEPVAGSTLFLPGDMVNSNDIQIMVPVSENTVATAAQYTTTTYDVDGDTAAAAMSAANASSASGCGRPTAGCTNAQYTYNPTTTGSVKGAGQQYSASLSVTSVSVTVSISVSLPNWTGYKNAPTSEQKAWDAAVSKLRDHEEGHVAIFRAGVGEIRDAIQGTSAKGNGQSQGQATANALANLRSSVKDRFDAALATVQKRSNDYDLQP